MGNNKVNRGYINEKDNKNISCARFFHFNTSGAGMEQCIICMQAKADYGSQELRHRRVER